MTTSLRRKSSKTSAAVPFCRAASEVGGEAGSQSLSRCRNVSLGQPVKRDKIRLFELSFVSSGPNSIIIRWIMIVKYPVWCYVQYL